MIRFIAICLAFKASRRAVTALEYGLIAGLVVATIAVGFTGLANALSNQFATIGDSL